MNTSITSSTKRRFEVQKIKPAGDKKFRLTITSSKVSLKVPADITKWLEADLSLHAKKIAELINSSVSLRGEQKLSDFGSITLVSDSGKKGAKVTTKDGYAVKYFTPKGC